jgi:plastocyanin
MRRNPILAAVAASLALGLAACGSSSSHSSNSGGSGSTKSTGGASAGGATTTGATTTGASTTGASTTGGNTGGASASGASTIAEAADPSGSLSFTSKALHAKAGTVTVDFANKSPVGHNFTVADSSGKVLGATPTFSAGSKTLTVKLAAGTYTFYCSVPGHRQAGMQGTLTVS